MAHSVTARKRIRQSEKKRVYNRSIKREISTYVKRFLTEAEKKDKPAMRRELDVCISKLDKAVKKGVLHKNTVANRKSMLWRRFNEVPEGGGEG